MMIAMTEARAACAGEPDLVERIKKAMRATHEHWLVRDEPKRFNAALAGAMLESSPSDKERIVNEVNAIRVISDTLMGGDHKKLDALTPAAFPLHLMRMWREIAN